MKHRALGHSGLRVSEVSFGSWIGDTEGSALAMAREAFEAGITTFDTADVYGDGRAEVVLGHALKGIPRSQLVLCTKVAAPTGSGPNERGLSRKHIFEAVHTSLRRLKTDYLDLYQAHRFDTSTPLEETVRAFTDLIRQGKILYYGVSEWTASQIERISGTARALGVESIVSNQPQYNLLWRVIEGEVIKASEECGISQMAWSPLAQGVLAGKYRIGALPPEGSRAIGPARSHLGLAALEPAVLMRIGAVQDLASQAGVSLPHLAIAWVLRNPNVATAIVGATKTGQVAHSADASHVELPEDLVQQVDEILSPIVERDVARTPSQPKDFGSQRTDCTHSA